MKKVMLLLFSLLLVSGLQVAMAADCVEVDIELPATVTAGDIAEGTFELVNCGDEDAIITLEVAIDLNGNPFTVASVPVPMGAGEVASREFRMPVPTMAAESTVTICVTATSGDAQDNDCATVYIAPPSSAPSDDDKTITFTMATADECVDLSLELPDTVVAGDDEFGEGYFELTNCGDEAADIELEIQIDMPDTTITLSGMIVPLGAGETISKNFTFPVPPFIPGGDYTFCVTATSGEAVATACQTMYVESNGGSGVPFEACGVLVQGTNCVLFAPAGDEQNLLALDNYGDFQVGDTCCVSGILVVDCATTCTDAQGCVINNSIYQWTPPSGNYPNPFVPNTTIFFELPSASHVRLAVYNVLGQEVRVLADEMMPAGEHYIEWDGTDDSGMKLSSGVYFYRLQTDERVQTKKMLMVK